MPNRKRDSKAVSSDAAFFDRAARQARSNAAVAAGAAGVAAAGAFLWSRRDQIGEAFNSGMDRLSELKAERMGDAAAARRRSPRKR